MNDERKRLRAALIQSLREKPLLVSEDGIFLPHEIDSSIEKLRNGLLDMLRTASTLVEGDRLSYEDLGSGNSDQFRDAVKRALSGGARLTGNDAELFHELGFEKLSEFRSTLYADLGGPAEIPKQDLAIYVSLDDERVVGFKEALKQQFDNVPQGISYPISETEEPVPSTQEQIPAIDLLKEEAILEEHEPSPPSLPPSDIATLAEQVELEEESQDKSQEEQVEALSLTFQAPESEKRKRSKLSVQDLNPVPRLTAAMEAAGIDVDDFGFILRYGRYAPEGRRSDFLVGGLGLAELSKRIVAWLEGQAPMAAQVQVVDDGSGELSVYLIAQEAS